MVRKKQRNHDTAAVYNPIQQDGETQSTDAIYPQESTYPSISMEATAAAAVAAASLQLQFGLDTESGVNIVDPQTATELLLTSEMTASIKNIDSEIQESQHDISFAHSEIVQSANAGDFLEKRRRRDRQKYANMTNEERTEYNVKRRAQYHRQSDLSRKKRRERERKRYHALSAEEANERNERRAAMERERYKQLSKEELEERNQRRRERAAQLRREKANPIISRQSSVIMEDAVKDATEAAIAAVVTSFDIIESSEV